MAVLFQYGEGLQRLTGNVDAVAALIEGPSMVRALEPRVY